MSLQLAEQVIEISRAAGASAAEVVVRKGTEFSVTVRLGEVEKIQQANFRKLGVRIFQDGKSAAASTSDFSPQTLRAVVEDTLRMARAASCDPAAGLPERELYARRPPVLELAFPLALDTEEKIALARRCEHASLRFDPRITNSEGAAFTDSATDLTYASSLGVGGSYSKTLASLYTVPLAERNGQKQRDYWLSTGLDAARLETPEEVGAEAARRVLRRLGARKVPTCEVPVVFDPLSAGRLMQHLADALSGTALVRKASFLLDRLGTRIASPLVTVVDDGLLAGGLGSRPFDSEGVPSHATPVIEAGILVGYLLDSYSARKLGMRSTGNSAREVSGAPKVGPSNLYLTPGSATPQAIIGSVRSGLYVTELIGFGVNIVSGDYSQGAAGLWIENGELAYPVEEITIAGNLRDMLAAVEAVGNDPSPTSETFAPTVKIGKMVVSGN